MKFSLERMKFSIERMEFLERMNSPQENEISSKKMKILP